MKKIFNLLLALPLLLLVACTADDTAAPSVEASTKYTINGSIAEGTRLTYAEEGGSMNCHWEVGDKVVLQATGATDNYEFTVESVNAIGTAVMTHYGIIPGSNSFTGTATYAPCDATLAGKQTANDNTEHLKYGETMVAQLTNQKVEGTYLTFTHSETAVYKVVFKAPVDFVASDNAMLTLSGAWTTGNPSLTLNFTASKDAVVTAYIIDKEGSLAKDATLKVSLTVGADTYSYKHVSTEAITYEAGKYWVADISDKEMKKPEPEPVDLGLPSGTKWASYNLGASAPEEYGDYYGWGCTEPYAKTAVPNWNLYFQKLGKSGGSEADCGTTNDPLASYVNTPTDKGISESQWDVARQKLGGDWRLPTYTEIDELMATANTTWTWQDNYNGSGVNGFLVTSKKNSNSIFLPAAGFLDDTGGGIISDGEYGIYWGSTPYSNYKERGNTIEIHRKTQTSGEKKIFGYSRCNGFSVRAVKK